MTPLEIKRSRNASSNHAAGALKGAEALTTPLLGLKVSLNFAIQELDHCSRSPNGNVTDSENQFELVRILKDVEAAIERISYAIQGLKGLRK